MTCCCTGYMNFVSFYVMFVGVISFVHWYYSWCHIVYSHMVFLHALCSNGSSSHFFEKCQITFVYCTPLLMFTLLNFFCIFCTFSFFYNFHLTLNLKCSRIFSLCSKCEMTFIYKNYLNYHLNNEHEDHTTVNNVISTLEPTDTWKTSSNTT